LFGAWQADIGNYTGFDKSQYFFLVGELVVPVLMTTTLLAMFFFLLCQT
jgi:hypothetical protein